MSKDHVCYMKTTAEEEETRLLKRKQEKRAKEDDDVKKWIFFDFECTQDEIIQCNEGYQPQQQIACGNCNQSDCHTNPCQQGYIPKKMTVCRNCHRPSCGSFRHVPNLCVVHKVCEECIDEDEIDKHSFWTFVNINSEYSRVLTHVTNSVNGCFQRKTKKRLFFVITFEGTIAIPSLVTCTKMLYYRKWSWMDPNSWALRYPIWGWNLSTQWISFQWLSLKSQRLLISQSWPKDTFHISSTIEKTNRLSLIVFPTWSTIIREAWCQRIVKNLYRGTMNIKTTHFISRKRSPNIADLTWISWDGDVWNSETFSCRWQPEMTRKVSIHLLTALRLPLPATWCFGNYS